MSIGGAEIVIVILVVLVLFGPTLAAFWLGYTLGRRRTPEVTTEVGEKGEGRPTEDDHEGSEHD